MGEERRGVFKVMRFVTGVARLTAEAGKPRGISLSCSRLEIRLGHTDIAGENEEVIVSEAPILPRVYQLLHIKSVTRGIIMLQDFESFSEVEGVLIVQELGTSHATHVAVCERHF